MFTILDMVSGEDISLSKKALTPDILDHLTNSILLALNMAS